MIFASDNWAGASDRVVAAIAEASRGSTPAYGGDDLTAELERRFSELFERDVGVLTVGTGTAANALGIAAFCRPGGVVFAHTQAHILVDEANAVAFVGSGAKVVGVDGEGGKLTPATLEAAVALYPPEAIRHGQPVAVSVSQISELGLAYSPEEVGALASVAASGGLAVHMDGARFAGAVAQPGVSPAGLTWKSGVDVLSFGGTKNGCVAAEALIFFDPARAEDSAFARLRIGHGFSKQWFVAAQLLAYLEDDHWLDLAGDANAMAERLADALRGSDEARLALEPAANEVLAVMSVSLDERLKAAGAIYYPWSTDGMPVAALPGEGEVLVRLVTSFRTSEAEVEQFASLLSTG
ncbi:MAG: low specificity L-threonine aldolase [Hyphomicrobiales bacterium]|nr:low specificity L-threonine aldolase [Hyphomicrobiales bacterium]